MEFLPIIIGVVIAIIAGASKSKKRAGNSVPAPHRENFPFPQEFRDLFDFEPKEESQSRQLEQRTGVEEFQSGQEGVAMTLSDNSSMPVEVLSASHRAMNMPISQRKAGIVVDAPIEVDRGVGGRRSEGDFDLRRAVIYSEILKPKYNDNLL